MDASQLLAALISDGDQDGYNIDQHCWHYARVTGTPCPGPELFGAGDRSIAYSVATFASIAAGGFNGNAPGDVGGGGPVLTVPGVVPGTGGNGAVMPGNGGGGLGSLFSGGGIMPLILIGLIVWFILED